MMKAISPGLKSEAIGGMLTELGFKISDPQVNSPVVNAMGAVLHAAVPHIPVRTSSHFERSTTWLEDFGHSNERTDVGDFNGDCRDDVVSLNTTGDVSIAISAGSDFVAKKVWLYGFCTDQRVCAVGDFNGDGKDDILSIEITGVARVALSKGTRLAPPTVWHNALSLRKRQDVKVGNFSDVVAEFGPELDDVAVFVHGNDARTLAPDEERGEVYVALSTGSGFGLRQRWHQFFAPGPERIGTGDVLGKARWNYCVPDGLLPRQ